MVAITTNKYITTCKCILAMVAMAETISLVTNPVPMEQNTFKIYAIDRVYILHCIE
jgi:hypothetical protein